MNAYYRIYDRLCKISDAGLKNCFAYFMKNTQVREEIARKDMQVIIDFSKGYDYEFMVKKHKMTRQNMRYILLKWEKAAEKVMEEKRNGKIACDQERSCGTAFNQR